MAVSSDAITGALEIYSAVKQNSDRVPGLQVAATEMAEFFKRTRKKSVCNCVIFDKPASECKSDNQKRVPLS